MIFSPDPGANGITLCLPQFPVPTAIGIVRGRAVTHQGARFVRLRDNVAPCRSIMTNAPHGYPRLAPQSRIGKKSSVDKEVFHGQATASDTAAKSCQGTILLPSAIFVCSLEGEGRRSFPYTEDVAQSPFR